MRVAFDISILVYAETVDDKVRHRASLDLLRRIRRHSIVVPVQVLGELFRVLTRKGKCPPARARSIVAKWQSATTQIGTSPETLESACDLAVQHRLDIWDAVILAAASEAKCRLLLSEDFQDGYTWGGVTVVNPFASTPHELLADLLETPAPS